MQDLGVFHSLGALWVRVLQELEDNGVTTAYTDNVGELADVKELLNLTAEVQNVTLPDAIIEKQKVQEEYDWIIVQLQQPPELLSALTSLISNQGCK